jgi:hypothetical protein
MSERLATIEHELLSARIYLGRAVRVENDLEVGSGAYLEVFEIIDELLARIEQLELRRLAVLTAIRRHEGRAVH